MKAEQSLFLLAFQRPCYLWLFRLCVQLAAQISCLLALAELLRGALKYYLMTMSQTKQQNICTVYVTPVFLLVKSKSMIYS